MEISEVQEFLSISYNIEIGLKNILEAKVETNYLVFLVFTVEY